MTDPRDAIASAETPSESSPVRSLLWLGAGAVALLALLVAVFVALTPGSAGAIGRRAFFGGHHGPLDPDEMREHFARGASVLASFADADEAQEAQIESIATRLADEIAPLGERHRANRDAIVAALAGPAVDRAALEQARGAELALAAEASAAFAEALADTAEVLTPEQRAKLLERHRRFHGER